MDTLRRLLGRIDGASYRAYRDLRGRYRGDGFDLAVDYVQGDPFAAPSRVRLRVPFEETPFADRHRTGVVPSRALCDFLARSLSAELRGRDRRGSGSGNSGVLAIDCGGQEILERSAVVLRDGFVEARFRVGLPAAGRRILGRKAEQLLCRDLPSVLQRGLLDPSLAGAALERHIEAAVEQDALRALVEGAGLVAFVADGAILPRASGISDRPMEGEDVVPFASPPSLRRSFELPSGREVTGMGVPQGLTLIVGGGYHGKSTLLSCIERGIYDHVPGDGRELCVSVPTAFKVRAEEGRRVEAVDISPFIGRLPLGRGTRDFATDDASGSTSQAAGIIEALELGTKALLLDEDTSATNFLIRDQRMQALVAREREPITPLVDRVADLTGLLGCSLVLVLGGNGDYFEQADTVIQMDAYRPRDVTERARQIAEELPSRRVREADPLSEPPRQRIPLRRGFDPSRGRRDVKISSGGIDEVRFGEETIDLAALEQLVDPCQTRAIGDAIHYCAQHYVDGQRPLKEGVERTIADLEEHGLDELAREQGDAWREYAQLRPLELGAAINRLRSLRMEQER